MSNICQYWWEVIRTYKGKKKLGKISVIKNSEYTGISLNTWLNNIIYICQDMEAT